MLFDVVTALVVVGASVTIVVGIAAPWISSLLATILGIWTGAMTLLALPALFVLHASPPRVRLSQRSALFASASWFARSVWAGSVFALSIVLGAVAGIVASRVSDSEHNLGTALTESIAGVAQLTLWPIVLTVAAVAYVVMGARWMLDLGRIVEEGGALKVLMTLEERWFGPKELSIEAIRLRRAGSLFVVSFAGRVALFLVLVTVAATVALAASAIVALR